MISITVIGILLSALAPNVEQYLIRARDSRRITDLNTLQKALVVYKYDTYKLPVATNISKRKDPYISQFPSFRFIEVAQAFWGGGWGGCPMIGILCAPWYDPYQDPVSCIESCVVSAWPRTDSQCASYLSDSRFLQLVGNIPHDPKKNIAFPCLDSGNIGSYWYNTLDVWTWGEDHFLLTAKLELWSMGNVSQNEIQAALSSSSVADLQDRKKGDYVYNNNDPPYYIMYE